MDAANPEHGVKHAQRGFLFLYTHMGNELAMGRGWEADFTQAKGPEGRSFCF